jgi:magnesium chelatase subunit D
MSALPAGACNHAALAVCVFAVDPASLGGLVVRSPAGDGRERFLAALRAMLRPDMPVRKILPSIDDDRLLGGLDLAATLRSGRPVLARGVLAETDGGVIVVPSAERISASLAARLGAALDGGGVAIEREGLTGRVDCRLGLILLDEGIGADEAAPSGLLDRLALHVQIDGAFDRGGLPFDRQTIESASERLRDIGVDPCMTRALAEAATVFGVDSGRALIFALRVARIHAALNGRMTTVAEDAAIAARLVLAPRATMLPAVQQDEETTPPPPDNSEQSESDSAELPDAASEMVLEAVRAAIPSGLLDRIGQRSVSRTRSLSGGRSANLRASLRRGRPAGTRPGDLKPGIRLNLVETMKAAAPWQRLRGGGSGPGSRVQVRREDFRILRFKQPSESLTIFVVDASGSSAFHRLAEAKGAVELLLADCYVRRDQVALLAFRGNGAELLLPPTRSLTRAKRSLAELPAGGATPLATGLDQSCLTGQLAMRRGQTPLLVVLTDARANIARDGCAGRERAEADALAAGRMVRSLRIDAIMIDTSQQASPVARRLAEEMNARYLPLPRAGAAAISGAVKSVREQSVS